MAARLGVRFVVSAVLNTAVVMFVSSNACASDAQALHGKTYLMQPESVQPDLPTCDLLFFFFGATTWPNPFPKQPSPPPPPLSYSSHSALPLV